MIIVPFVALLILVIFGILAIVFYFYLDFKGYFDSKEQYYFNKELGVAINSNKSAVRIDDLTNFKWDECCMYFPYEYSTINPSKRKKRNGAELADDIYNIQFNYKGEEIIVLNINRGYINVKSFSDNIRLTCNNKSAIFIFKDKQIINFTN